MTPHPRFGLRGFLFLARQLRALWYAQHMKVITLGDYTFRTEDVDMIRLEPSCCTIFVRTKAGKEHLIYRGTEHNESRRAFEVFSEEFQDAVQDA